MLSILGGAVSILPGLIDDAQVWQRGCDKGNSFGDELNEELRQQNPKYLISPFGVMPNPYYLETESY